MKTLLKKLSSRKFWTAMAGIIVGISAAFGIGENEYAQIAGIVTSAISVASYLFCESMIDMKHTNSDTEE